MERVLPAETSAAVGEGRQLRLGGDPCVFFMMPEWAPWGPSSSRHKHLGGEGARDRPRAEPRTVHSAGR